jgi:hypothetical protein
MDNGDPKPKRPFMPMRDGAGSFELNNPDDGTPIKEMFTFKDRLLLVTEKCTYEIQTADQIDPKRSNPNLPHHVQRKIFDHGIGSEALSKILLQARTLFKDGFLPIDVEAAQKLAVEALKEFDAMDHTAKEFKDQEKLAIEGAEQATQQPRSLSLPSIGGVDTHCKTFAQKAHHFGKATLAIARLFIPAATNWDSLSEIILARYGKDDQFSKLIAEVTPNLKMVLNLRDALEHQNKAVIVRDFTMEPDGTISPPTIELNFRKTVLARTSIESLMDGLITALPVYFEMTIVFLSSKFAQQVAGLPVFVDLLPEDFQKARHVRFGYWAKMPNGQAMPFG